MTLRVAIGGFGTIGRAVGRALDAGIDGLSLVAVSGRDRAKAEAGQNGFRRKAPVMALGELAEAADVVVGSAPAAAFADVALPAIEKGRILVATSVGALLPRMELVDLARERGARIVVPTGALLGLDAVRAAAENDGIRSVAMVTRKPPGGLAGAPWLVENGISVDGLEEPLLVFRGTAREGVAGFPANVNVAAALALAGVGPDRTRLEIWADPTIDRNTHHIEVESDCARFSLEIAGLPTVENPRTGRIVAPSVIACLRGLTAPLRVGS